VLTRCFNNSIITLEPLQLDMYYKYAKKNYKKKLKKQKNNNLQILHFLRVSNQDHMAHCNHKYLKGTQRFSWWRYDFLWTLKTISAEAFRTRTGSSISKINRNNDGMGKTGSNEHWLQLWSKEMWGKGRNTKYVVAITTCLLFVKSTNEMFAFNPPFFCPIKWIHIILNLVNSCFNPINYEV
jgi:hypothetical protein